MANELDIVSEVIEAENLVTGNVFTDLWAKAKRNSEFYALKQWTKEEEATHKKQNRIPFIFDKTSHAVNTLLGTQRDSRTQIQFIERTKEDAQKVDTMNAVWKYYEDVNEFIYHETDVFQDALVSRVGMFGCEITKKDGLPYLKVGRVPFDQVVWDTNSRNYDLSDASFMSERLFYRRNALNREYPDKASLIKVAGMDKMMEPQARPLKYDTWFDSKKDLIGVRRFYERDYKTKYLIWMRGQEIPEDTPFTKKKDAQIEIKNRLAMYDKIASDAKALRMPVIPRPEFFVIPIDFPIVNRTVVLINGVLEEKSELPLGDFPLTPYFAYYHDGEFWSAIDRLKDPQIFYNRMMAQADYSVGTMAKGVLRIDPNVPRNQKAQIKAAWGKTGGAFEAKANQLEMFESKGPAVQLFSMMDRAENILDDTFGGANFLGMKQTASESGRAVLARQQQAGLDNFVLLDNMRRTKWALGKKIAYYLTHDITQAQKLRIQGHSLELNGMIDRGIAEPSGYNPSVAYVEVNTEAKNSIENLEVDVIVGEAAYSSSKMQASIASMVDLFKAIPGLPPPPMDIVIDMAPIPEEMKMRWKANIPEEKPEPKITANYKDLTPDVQLQVLESWGFSPDLRALAMKELSSNKLVQQEQKGVQQKKIAQLTQKEKSGNA